MRMRNATEPGSSRRRRCGPTPSLKTTGARNRSGRELRKSGWSLRKNG